MARKFVKDNVDIDYAKLKQTVESAGAKKRWLRNPGTYTFTIVGVKDKGIAADPNWDKFVIELETTSGEKLNHFLMIPVTAKNGFTYKNPNVPNAKETTLPLYNYQRFLIGLGVDFSDYSILEPVTEAILTDVPGKLVNLQIKARVDYTGLHIKYLGKDEEDKNIYQVWNNTKPFIVEGAELGPCKSVEACKNQLLSLDIDVEKLSPFPDIKEIFPGENVLNIVNEDDTHNDVIPF